MFFSTSLPEKRSDKGNAVNTIAVALGMMLSVSALPMLAIETLMGRGGTLIAVAGKDL